MVAETIGPYQILEEIGRGGIGIVYKAVDTRLNRPVAIKSLQATGTSDETAQKRFLREAKTVAHLDHPYICKIYEILEHAGKTHIVLEYVRGKPLSELVLDSQEPIQLEKVLEMGIEIAEALEEAHKNGIVHRDIKPSNIMLLESGHIKVLDFGLAKVLNSASDLSSTASAALTGKGIVVGTLTHMSPEQVMGRDVDTRSDIFSFGIVLYELIAGRCPFGGATAAEVAASILSKEAEPLHRYRRDVPENLDRVVQRMLEKDPNERYQSVHEVWVQLRHLREELAAHTSKASRAGQRRQGEPERGMASPTIAQDEERTTEASNLEASSTGTVRPLRHKPRSRRWAFGLTTALGIILVIAFVLYYQGSQPVLSFSPRGWILISDFKNETGDTLFDKSLGTAFTVSISQSRYANVIPRSRTSAVLQRMGRKPDVPLDEEVGREICLRENITGLICPSIGKIGNQFILTARIVDPRTGESVRSYMERAADYSRILHALDLIAASVRKGLGESIRVGDVTSRPLAEVTTSSLQALKLFTDAMQLWNKGQYAAAAQQQKLALKEDPNFAMAHAALGVYYCSFIFNDLPEGKRHFEAALRLADRTSEREKQSIRLEYESNFGTFDAARDLYVVFLQSYPDSIGERYNFGNILRDHREFEKAIEQYKEALRIYPDYASAHINLATCYSALGQLQESLDSYGRAFRLEPSWMTSGNLNHEYGFTLVRAGDPAKARQVFNQALATIKPTALRSLALLDLYQGKYRDARSNLQQALLSNKAEKALLSEARNHIFIYILLQGMGDQVESQRELDAATGCLESLPPQVWMTSRIGVGYARGRSVDKAARILDKIQKLVNPNDSIQTGDLHRLEGELELARGNKARAVELLQLADRENHSPLTVESLARAFEISGNTDEAVTAYETVVDMSNDAAGWEPQQDWLGAHVKLAKLYLGRNEIEKARKILGQFLELWKEADPGLPLNKDALSLMRKVRGS